MGEAHARALAERGADVLMADLDGAELEVSAKQIAADTGRRTETVVLDVTSPDAGERVRSAIEAAFGRLDIVVHNAGIMHDWKTLAETPVENLQPYLDVNVLGPYAITRTLMPLLQAGPAGRIVFINSQWGQLPDGHSYGYMVAKAAQLGMMKALASEFVSQGVLINAVAPGAVATRMVPDEVYDIEVAAVPLGRLGQPGEIAAAVAFLASDAAGFLAGQTLAVNGGALIPSA
ncbi:3-oxoacyl-ACP reductase FabG [Tsukamurella soli]|uniref:3-oxoacyl-ACP reductase FabG n=2 Tax=Tsukamurella soli TaxID=644556 RepID=A0ABP8JN52_9ACTN